MDYKQWALSVFQIESQAILSLGENLTEDFSHAVNAIHQTSGKVIVMGVGKSGIMGRKIAGTLASTGTPAIFIHPTDAIHGDLGMIQTGDIILAVSYSGETEEILRLIPFFLNKKHLLLSVTGNPLSTLAKQSQYHLNVKVEKEACPLELAPTSSATATLVMGDALAVALMNLRNFSPEHFAVFHPGGSLGKRLITTVESVMIKENLPVITAESSMKSLIETMTKGKLGIAIVVNDTNHSIITGIVTDGDLRRAMDKYESTFFRLTVGEIMTSSPKMISPQTKMAEAEILMTDYKISALLVAENQRLMGVVQVYQVNI
ncbi:MAG: KpsF/GutQ family sugar-phosphate isomerase [Bacteroidia bacterium]|nr:KpsF/GutQ family sugar-phosphate isomerase [Bacteroidia bacterium]